MTPSNRRRPKTLVCRCCKHPRPAEEFVSRRSPCWACKDKQARVQERLKTRRENLEERRGAF